MVTLRPRATLAKPKRLIDEIDNEPRKKRKGSARPATPAEDPAVVAAPVPPATQTSPHTPTITNSSPTSHLNSPTPHSSSPTFQSTSATLVSTSPTLQSTSPALQSTSSTLPSGNPIITTPVQSSTHATDPLAHSSRARSSPVYSPPLSFLRSTLCLLLQVIS